MEFVLRIQIGNDDMEQSVHVARALRAVATRMEEKGYLEDIMEEGPKSLPFTRGIKDSNGNTVGEWTFQDG